jgi:hypothetical protein
MDRLHFLVTLWLLFDGYCIEALDSGCFGGAQPVVLQLGLVMTKEGPTGKINLWIGYILAIAQGAESTVIHTPRRVMLLST